MSSFDRRASNKSHRRNVEIERLDRASRGVLGYAAPSWIAGQEQTNLSPPPSQGVERAFGTLQDRLMKELRLAGVSSIAAANAWLPGFITAHNTRFSRDPANAKDLHRPLAQADDLDEILAWREARTVTQNLTLHYDRMMLLLDPTPVARGLVRKKVVPYRSHGCSMMLGPDAGLKGCASRTGKRRLRPLTPSPAPSSWLTCRVTFLSCADICRASVLRPWAPFSGLDSRSLAQPHQRAR